MFYDSVDWVEELWIKRAEECVCSRYFRYMPETTTFASGKMQTNTYDGMGRLTQRRLSLSSNYDVTMTYVSGANDSQTALLATYRNRTDAPYAYAYDDNGNITSITRNSTVAVSYQYNGANELVRENNGFTNQTVTYTYDTWGNITEKKIYAYTTASNPGTPTETISYTYGNSAWKDRLTKYNGQTISYDAICARVDEMLTTAMESNGFRNLSFDE